MLPERTMVKLVGERATSPAVPWAAAHHGDLDCSPELDARDADIRACTPISTSHNPPQRASRACRVIPNSINRQSDRVEPLSSETF
jgi:hypothetical protein